MQGYPFVKEGRGFSFLWKLHVYAKEEDVYSGFRDMY